MSIVSDLLTRVQDVSKGLADGAIIKNVVTKHREDILNLQKRQLFEGKASSGKDIRPYYSEDLQPSGYFKTADAAKRYSAWKQDGINYPFSANRNPNAPNLYINGKFHSELGVDFYNDSIAVVGRTPYARGIVEKYGMATFGLTKDNWNAIFMQYGGYDELINEIKSILYA